MKFSNYLNEASNPGRLGSKMKNIDGLFSWLYDKDILTATDKKKKDSMFNKYYRYYNDGDFPRGLKDLTRWDHPDDIALALEKQVEDFIKYVLAKYVGKYDRNEFRISKYLKQLKNLKARLTDSMKSHGTVSFWLDRVSPALISKSDFLQNLEEIKNIETKLTAEIKAAGYSGTKYIDVYTPEYAGDRYDDEIVDNLSKDLLNKRESLYKELSDKLDIAIEAFNKAKNIVNDEPLSESFDANLYERTQEERDSEWKEIKMKIYKESKNLNKALSDMAELVSKYPTLSTEFKAFKEFYPFSKDMTRQSNAVQEWVSEMEDEAKS